jgi:HEPN domain-containing protein
VNRRDFQALSRLRLAEAKALLDAGFYDGAYYLSGYAVECALKACIARQTRQHDFPPTVADVRDMYTHDLGRLVRLAGLEPDRLARVQACSIFAENWTTVKDWNEASRYARWSAEDAKSLHTSVVDRRHGVLRWLRLHW